MLLTGARRRPIRNYVGLLDEYAIWRVVLTADETATLSRCGA
jgi:hypothetical protein